MQSLPHEVRRIAGEMLLSLAGEDAGDHAKETLPSGSLLEVRVFADMYAIVPD